MVRKRLSRQFIVQAIYEIVASFVLHAREGCSESLVVPRSREENDNIWLRDRDFELEKAGG